MTNIFWIWCGLLGESAEWHLVAERGEELYFVAEDTLRRQEKYLRYPCVKVEVPEKIPSKVVEEVLKMPNVKEWS